VFVHEQHLPVKTFAGQKERGAEIGQMLQNVGQKFLAIFRGIFGISHGTQNLYMFISRFLVEL
jgi:hypothetical protein